MRKITSILPTVSFEYKKKNDARFDVIDKMPEKTFWSIG